MPAAKAPPRPLLAVTWLDKPPAIDGDLGDWNLAAGVRMDGGSGRTAEVALGRDAEKLYLAYRVREPRPPAKRRRRLADALRHRRLRRPDAGHRCPGRPAPPRRRAGRPAAVVQPLSKAGPSPCSIGRSSPVPRRRSPSPPIHIDRVDASRLGPGGRPPRRCPWPVHGRSGRPLQDLGIDPKSTAGLRGDVGVIFADESGRSRSLRLYYYNRHTETVFDVPTEATLQPARVGTAGDAAGPKPAAQRRLRGAAGRIARKRPSRGWFVVSAQNGSGAVHSGESPYSGHRSLLVGDRPRRSTFPPAAYDAPDYEVFRRSANGGKGGGWVEVVQKVPVTAGHRYSLRYRYRCEDFQPERKQPGHPRGYVAFYGRHRLAVRAAAPQFDRSAWRPFTNRRPSGGRSPISAAGTCRLPTLAPEGATAVQLVFGMETLAEGRLPKFFLDDVELVDVTP